MGDTPSVPHPEPGRPGTHGTGCPAVAILSGGRELVGYGPTTELPRGPAGTLGRRVREFLDGNSAAAMVAGSLPFNRDALDCVVSVGQVEDCLPEPPARRSAPEPRWLLRPEPSADRYAAAVANALTQLEDGSGDLRKVVLARTLHAVADRPVDLLALLHRLHADSSVTAFLVPLPARPGAAPRVLAGATPELLVARTGRKVVSHPLAGSARREADPTADEAARTSLAASEKDAREHALVPAFILDTLAPYCRTLSAPVAAITSTRTMWHLGTRIEGELRDPDVTAADLAALLHPTPAVCGVPHERAAAVIQELEPFDRGFYAGAVGWCDRAGNGAWHVALRCAEIAGHEARLFAGAGIVPGSRPEAEVAETRAKFRAVLHALGAGDAELPA